MATKTTGSVRSALGFRVKSGWATAILLSGPLQSPLVVDKTRVELCDPAVPDSRQPYHAMEGKPEAEGRKIVERLRKLVFSAADQSVGQLVRQYQKNGYKLAGAGLVVGSDIDPMKLKNEHIRAHALEGRLFRTAVEEALQSCGLTFSILVEKNAYTDAAGNLKKSEAELKHAVAELGRALEGPWRSDEKTATLAAWLALAL